MRDARQTDQDPHTQRPWQQQGTAPDYRFSLANERTFLAWIRTALALLAGAVAIDQFTTTLASPAVRQGIAVLLALAAALMAGMAYRRWAGNERAMRNGLPLPYTSMLVVFACGLGAVAIALALLIVQL
ncbi:YidH family protein [Lonsdalea quercina]|uniref:YidH family protein n=1 Tax=Lonsdalea quercina TaxID=71657 RepID=UPI00397627A9